MYFATRGFVGCVSPESKGCPARQATPALSDDEDPPGEAAGEAAGGLLRSLSAAVGRGEGKREGGDGDGGTGLTGIVSALGPARVARAARSHFFGRGLRPAGPGGGALVARGRGRSAARAWPGAPGAGAGTGADPPPEHRAHVLMPSRVASAARLTAAIAEALQEDSTAAHRVR